MICKRFSTWDARWNNYRKNTAVWFLVLTRRLLLVHVNWKYVIKVLVSASCGFKNYVLLPNCNQHLFELNLHWECFLHSPWQSQSLISVQQQNSWARKPALPWQAAQRSNHVTNLSCSIIAHSTGSLIWWFHVSSSSSSSSPFSAETSGTKSGKIKLSCSIPPTSWKPQLLTVSFLLASH